MITFPSSAVHNIITAVSCLKLLIFSDIFLFPSPFNNTMHPYLTVVLSCNKVLHVVYKDPYGFVMVLKLKREI